MLSTHSYHVIPIALSIQVEVTGALPAPPEGLEREAWHLEGGQDGVAPLLTVSLQKELSPCKGHAAEEASIAIREGGAGTLLKEESRREGRGKGRDIIRGIIPCMCVCMYSFITYVCAYVSLTWLLLCVPGIRPAQGAWHPCGSYC